MGILRLKMADVWLINSGNGLVPASPEDSEALGHMKLGERVRAKITRPRNPQFHRKFFALMKVGYDAFDPPEIIGQKNFDQFRKDVIIRAGYYEQWVRLDGSIQTVAKSISFGKMSQEDFEKLYSACIDVLLQSVLSQYTQEDIDQVVDEVLGFC